MNEAPNTLQFTIKGEPASKANSREIVRDHRTGLPKSIKSKKARTYAQMVAAQAPMLPRLLEGELAVKITIYYASQRPDLDESVILDGLQKRVFENDRQVREKHVYHAIDKANPRAEIEIWPRSA